MMAATAIMATVTAAIIVVMNTGYAAWNAQEADIDVLENGYGVLTSLCSTVAAGDRRLRYYRCRQHHWQPVVYHGDGRDLHLGTQFIVRRVLQQRHEQSVAGQEHQFDDIYRLQGGWHHRNHDGHRDPSCSMPGTNHAASRRRHNANALDPSVASYMVIRMFVKQRNLQTSPRFRAPKARRTPGIALLICLFVLSLVTVWTVDMLESASVYQSALRNSIEYEQALYQANAGVQHVLSQLEADVTWRGTATAR